MKRPKASIAGFWLRAQWWALPTILLACVSLPKLGQGAFRTDTGWYAAIGLQAWRTGELWTLWGEPGQPYFNKPPLAFWIHGLFLHLVGPHLWAARLPSVLAGLGCVAAMAGLARTLAGPRAGLGAGLVLALTYEFFRRTREISLDVWQLLFVLLAVWAVVSGLRRERPSRILLAGLPMGLALLTKPLVAFVFVPILLVWLVWTARTRAIGWLLLATLVALVVGGSWHISMYAIHGEEFLRQYFGAEIVQRVGSHAADTNAGTGSLLYYPNEIVRTYWPWMVPLVMGLVTWISGKRLCRDSAMIKLVVVWTVFWVVALSVFPDKRPRYAIVLYPAWAMLAGLWLTRCSPVWLHRFNRRAVRLLGPAAVGIALIVAVAPIRVQGEENAQWPALFAWMEAQDVNRGDLWQGGFIGTRGARVYLETGWWPNTTRNRWGEVIVQPPHGAMMIYHRRDGLAPGQNEAILFSSGDLTVAQLGEGGWNPLEIADPGD